MTPCSQGCLLWAIGFKFRFEFLKPGLVSQLFSCVNGKEVCYNERDTNVQQVLVASSNTAYAKNRPHRAMVGRSDLIGRPQCLQGDVDNTIDE